VSRAYADATDDLGRNITPAQARLINYYGSSEVVYALAFGNDFARNRYAGRLYQLYPDALFDSIWERRFYSFAGDVPSNYIRRTTIGGHAVPMYGFSLSDGYAQYRAGLTLEPVVIRSDKAVYRLVEIDSTQMSQP
jgi:hypothetical protein